MECGKQLTNCKGNNSVSTADSVDFSNLFFQIGNSLGVHVFNLGIMTFICKTFYITYNGKRKTKQGSDFQRNYSFLTADSLIFLNWFLQINNYSEAYCDLCRDRDITYLILCILLKYRDIETQNCQTIQTAASTVDLIAFPTNRCNFVLILNYCLINIIDFVLFSNLYFTNVLIALFTWWATLFCK